MDKDYFKNIPDINFESLCCVSDGGDDDDDDDTDDFNVSLQKYTNSIIYLVFPRVAAFSLEAIHNELTQSLDMKQYSLKKLKEKYNKCNTNVNLVNDVNLDCDIEMIDINNVQLIPNAQTNTMKSTDERDLLSIIIKQFDENVKNNVVDKEIQDIFDFLKTACNYKFTQLSFTNNNQEILDELMIYRIVQVWEIFGQYFKQFDYLDYLQNYHKIENIYNSDFIFEIIHTLIDIGPINC